MDIGVLNTLGAVEWRLLDLLGEIYRTRAYQQQLGDDPGLQAWQEEMTLLQEPAGPLHELSPLLPAADAITPRDYCRGCGVSEGALHREGCDHEICPNCTEEVGRRCDCLFAPGDLGQSRVPFFAEPLDCCHRCKLSCPPMFLVPDALWQRYVPPHWQRKILCLECFVYMVRVTDQATRQPEAGAQSVATESFEEDSTYA